MTLAARENVIVLLVCPCCRGDLTRQEQGFSCHACGIAYPGVGDVPVLVDFRDSVLEREAVLSSGGASPVGPRRSARRRGAHMATVARNVAALLALIPDAGRVLVVGGGENSHGLEPLYEADAIDVVGFDVYASPLTQFIADAHRIPLRDGTVDAVVIQAVLEHVLEPERVVAEIHRVLKDRGVVYAETAFLQAVHEGPYDFIRFTERGHRWLFRWFDELDGGAIGGAGLSLAWALDYFVRGLTRRRRWGLRARRLVTSLAQVDRAIPARFRVDAAPAHYFLGRRSNAQLSPSALVHGYRGADGVKAHA